MEENNGLSEFQAVSGLYQDWFLDYASYVILERAVPALEDGLKPVQRRVLHAMNVIDDGRFNKVANVIGQTMQYHPHGDASIGDALVNLGQKELLFETQGNWGDIRTGDKAAAPRYIEVRLSKFAKEVVFNPKTTEWQLSYDGRKKEPVTLPVKFPLLLAQGVEGIAVGLATKILPHNFCELLEASIDILNNRPVSLVPDFLTGGMIDATQYSDGKRGGKVKIRAKIKELDAKTLAITEIPYGTTTMSLIENIIKANDAGKIKIKKVVDNTAKELEIQIQLQPGVSPDVTIDALYAFTDCEVSISTNACVILGDKPRFMSVVEILEADTHNTVELLRQELEIERAELMEKILFSSLEKIFIENRIYRDIEECETWESVIETIDKGLEPHKPLFYREITTEDIVRLTEIKIKRISKFDSFKADEQIKNFNAQLEEVVNHLAHIKQYATAWFKDLLKKYGKGRERRTEIRTFDVIAAREVAATNQKLYVNYEEGFIGYGLKKDTFVCDCSDIDDVITFRKNGICKVVKIGEKVFVGKDLLYVGIFRKGDERMVYNLIYHNGKTGVAYGKRFQVLGITRDKEYPLISEDKGSKILHFTANPNGEAEVVTINLPQASSARKKIFDFDFASLEIKGRSAQGNIVSKHSVKSVKLKASGKSTLGGLDVWYDETVGKLNCDKRGTYLGNFEGEDLIISLTTDGCYELNKLDFSLRFEPNELIYIGMFIKDKPILAIYHDGEQKLVMQKRFFVETTTQNKRFNYLNEHKATKLIFAAHHFEPEIEVSHKKDKKSPLETLVITSEELVDVKGIKAKGNRFNIQVGIEKIVLLNPEDPNQYKESSGSDDLGNDGEEGDVSLFEEVKLQNADALEPKLLQKFKETPKEKEGGAKPESTQLGLW